MFIYLINCLLLYNILFTLTHFDWFTHFDWLKNQPIKFDPPKVEECPNFLILTWKTTVQYESNLLIYNYLKYE